MFYEYNIGYNYRTAKRLITALEWFEKSRRRWYNWLENRSEQPVGQIQHSGHVIMKLPNYLKLDMVLVVINALGVHLKPKDEQNHVLESRGRSW